MTRTKTLKIMFERISGYAFRGTDAQASMAFLGSGLGTAKAAAAEQLRVCMSWGPARLCFCATRGWTILGRQVSE